jgi:Ca-activated chloride channel family protein
VRKAPWLLLLLAGCSNSSAGGRTTYGPPPTASAAAPAPCCAPSPGFLAPPASTETYDAIVENRFLSPKDQPLSTFSVDVDTASYANVRRFLNEGTMPPPGAVRLEELVNYFPYHATPPPTDGSAFAARMEMAECPWNPTNRLVRIAIQGKEMPKRERPPCNLVFLVDVSGSMAEPNKLPLVKTALRMLLEELDGRDQVSMVVYAGASGLVLPPTRCSNKAVIRQAIDALDAGGSTNGAAGIQLAYLQAREAFVQGGANRVILCTDGDFNVGVTDESQLIALIQEKAKSGVFLTALGFGRGT